jgi:hypothetical protein
MARPRSSQDRLFVRQPFRHYRRTYNISEVRWGFAVGAILVALAVWILWKKNHPHPSLSMAPPLVGGKGGASGPGQPDDRGPVPTDLAAPGWTAGELSRFGPDNLYVKINGRADYFLSFGFQQLYFVSLRHGEADDAPSVELEIYDLDSPSNALGAFSGEQKEGAETESAAGGVSYLARNALFVARGRYYVRAIGSEESAPVTAQLEKLRGLLIDQLEGADRPWAYELFVGGMQVDADRVSYAPRNAFSIAAARDLYIARLEDDAQLFAAVTGDEGAAAELAAALNAGFADVGEEVDGGWVKDRYLDTLAIAVADGRFVVGVNGAASAEQGTDYVDRVKAALAALPAELRTAARPAPVTDEPVDSHGEDEQAPDEEGGELVEE